MKSPVRVALRQILKWTHTWVGLTAGLVMAVISLTGSVIVFRSGWERASMPPTDASLHTVGLNELTRQISLSNPQAHIRRVRFPARPGDPFVVQVESAGKQQRLVCEASTGRVAGVLETKWTDWTIDLHRNLLSGKTGRKAVGIGGIVLFALAATGVLLWWIGARQWRAWISVRSQASSRRFHFELHRATGLWSYALLTVLAFTGTGLSFPDTFRSALRTITGSPAPGKAPRIPKSAEATLRPLDEYVRAGMAAMPDGVLTEMRLPDNGTAPVDLRSHRPGDLAPSGNHVYFEPSTVKVLSVSKASEQPLATQIFAAFAPIHYGEFGGLPIQLLWACMGVIPSVLFVTGLLTWWRPNSAKKAPVTRKELDLVESVQSAAR